MLPLYSDNVVLWFAQIDAFFKVHEILPERQLNLISCGMPPSLAKTVKEMLTRPSPDVTYEILKAEVLKRNTTSVESRFRLLIEDEHLGDRKPTEFLRRLLELTDTVTNNAPIIKKIILSPFAFWGPKDLAPP